MEEAGFRVDTGVLAKLSVEMEKELDKLSKKIYELAGREFNIGSPQQLGEIFEELNYRSRAARPRGRSRPAATCWTNWPKNTNCRD